MNRQQYIYSSINGFRVYDPNWEIEKFPIDNLRDPESNEIYIRPINIGSKICDIETIMRKYVNDEDIIDWNKVFPNYTIFLLLLCVDCDGYFHHPYGNPRTLVMIAKALFLKYTPPVGDWEIIEGDTTLPRHVEYPFTGIADLSIDTLSYSCPIFSASHEIDELPRIRYKFLLIYETNRKKVSIGQILRIISRNIKITFFQKPKNENGYDINPYTKLEQAFLSKLFKEAIKTSELKIFCDWHLVINPFHENGFDISYLNIDKLVVSRKGIKKLVGKNVCLTNSKFSFCEFNDCEIEAILSGTEFIGCVGDNTEITHSEKDFRKSPEYQCIDDMDFDNIAPIEKLFECD